MTITRHAYFFGYGSLVNRATHHFSNAYPAQLRGWRRVWRHTPLREVAYLTVVADEDSVIDGLIAAVPADDWAALDEREGAYDRVPASHQVIHTLDHVPDIAVYSVPDRLHGPPGEKGPVLLSYIDVVVKGYLDEYGEDGVSRFFGTTDGWDAPILDDRAAPRYPRHQRVDAGLRDLTDAHLKAVGASLRRA